MDVSQYAIVVLSSLSADNKNQPHFMTKVYGPFDSLSEAEEKVSDIRLIEGGAVMVRPMVGYWDTVRRISAD